MESNSTTQQIIALHDPTNEVRELLRKRYNATLLKCLSDNENDKALNELACVFGSKYEMIAKVLYCLRRTFQSDGENETGVGGFFIHEYVLPKNAVIVTQVLHKMREIGILSKLSFKKENKTSYVSFQISKTAGIKYFLEGGWLERYAYQLITSQVRLETRKVMCICNARLQFDDEVNREIDILLIVDGQLYLFETKVSSFYSSDIKKYRQIAKYTGIKNDHIFFVTADKAWTDNNPHTIYDMNFVSTEQLASELRKKLARNI